MRKMSTMEKEEDSEREKGTRNFGSRVKKVKGRIRSGAKGTISRG